MTEPIEYRNDYGKSLWQPVTSDGKRAYEHVSGAITWGTVYLEGISFAGWYIPYLTSYRRAKRLAARRERNQYRAAASEYRRAE